MIHRTVYQETGVYAGWPANHGAWQWGDEFLVGFLRGAYARNSMHNIVEPFELCQARSLDGGRTWVREHVEIPVDAVGAQTTKFDIGDAIIRVRGSYDHGGDWIDPMGCFWASEDKGRTWHGPHGFDGLESLFSGHLVNTSRTSTLGDLLFMSAADGRMWGTDYSFCAIQVDGEFRAIGTICDDDSRAVMPSVARASNGRLIAVCRRRRLMGAISEDGSNWNQFVVRDGGEEDIGYPRLFMRSDGVPVCVYYWSDKENLNQHIAATEISLPC